MGLGSLSGAIVAECICRGLGTNVHRADCPVVGELIDLKLGGDIDRRTDRTGEPFSWRKRAHKWDEEETCERRALVCLLYLNIHGVISDGERKKAIARLKKLVMTESAHG